MPATAKALREERAVVGKRIREMADKANDEKRDFQGEEIGNWKDSNERYNQLTRQIEIAERAEQVERDATDPVGDPEPGRDQRSGKKQRKGERRREEQANRPTDVHRNLAMQAWFRSQLDMPLSRHHREACQRTGMNPRRRTFDIKLRDGIAPTSVAEIRAREARAMSAIAGPDGAATIPEGFMPRLEVALLQYGGMSQVAETFRTESGNQIPWPTMNDTNNEGEMIGESRVPGNADPPMGSVLFSAYKASSRFIKVPYELFEDSAFMLSAYIADAIGERLGRTKNRKCTIGSGASEPTGILNVAKLGKTAANVLAISADEILDMERTVDPAYRIPGQFAYMCNDQTMLAIRKLKDGEGRYIWQQGLQAGDPDTLNGWRVQMNQHMPDIGPSAKSLVVGNLKKYKIREVGTIRMRRLVERFADADQEGFVAFMRFDANLLDAGTGPVTYLQHPAQ